ncbi:MAG: c-type cytochrome [Saprospiraceae bacterium]|nr:c-type cytochrome [Saprospiraceae bacterium]
MKKILKISAIIIAVLLGIILTVVLYVNFAPMPEHTVVPLPIQVSYDSSAVNQGRKIVETVCYTCHKGADERLSGAMFSKPESGLGEIWSANITNHSSLGIGAYRHGELAHMLRTGINRKGRFIGPFMLFPNMSDQDLAAVIAYLRSDSPITRPSDISNPKPSYSLIGKALFKLGVFKPLEIPTSTINAPAPSDTLAYGKYLATSVFACYECHSRSFETNDVLIPENSEGYFAGGNPIEDRNFEIVISANLTPSKEHGIGSWSKDDFKRAIRQGIRPNQELLSDVMPRFSLLSDQEVNAIWTYLESLPASEPNLAAAK